MRQKKEWIWITIAKKNPKVQSATTSTAQKCQNRSHVNVKTGKIQRPQRIVPGFRKKELYRKRGKDVKEDTKYTARKRRPRF